MAMIVPHQSQVGIATGNAGQAAPYRSASAFMTPGQSNMPEGLHQLAKGMDKLGNALAKYGLDNMKMQNATDMLADKIAYEDALRDFDSNYRQTHQGASARDAEQAYAQFHKEQHDKLQQKWGGNPFLMQGVNQMAESIRQPSMQRAVTYRDQQEDLYQKDLLATSEARALELCADPSRSVQEKETAIQDMERTLRMFAGQRPVMVDGKLQWQGGRNIDAQLMALRQKAQSSNIEGLIASGDTERAQLAVNRARGGGMASVPTHTGVARVLAFRESGTQGSLHVSYGLPATDGVDVGKYSMITKGGKGGSVGEFIRWAGTQGGVGAQLYNKFNELTGGNWNALDSKELWKSKGGEALWKEIAKSDPKGFEMLEDAFMGARFEKQIARLRPEVQAAIRNDKTGALYEMAISTLNQHRTALKILNDNFDADPETYIKKVYQDRSAPSRFAATGDPSMGARRMRGEVQDVLGILRGGQPGALPAKDLGHYQKQIDTLEKKQQVDGFLANTMDMPAPERLALLEEKYGNDPAKREVYDSIRQGIMHDANAKESMRNIERRDRKVASLKEMEKAANLPPDQSYQKMQEIGMRLPLEERAEFYKAANNLRNPGYYDDPWAVQEISDRMANGEEINVKAEYGSRLTPKTASRFTDQAFRNALPVIKNAFDDVANEWLATEKNKNHAKELGMGSKTALWTRFLAQTDADEKKDYARLRQEAADFFKKATLEKGWFNWDVETIQGLVGGVLDKYDDARPVQGTPEYGMVVELLKSANIEPKGFGGGYTDEQISAGYRQYRDMQKGGKK